MDKGLFTLDRALCAFDEVRLKAKKYQQITDDIYDRYVNGKRNRDFDLDVDSQENLELPESLKLPKHDCSTSKSASMSTVQLNMDALTKEINKMDSQTSAKKSLKEQESPFELKLNIDMKTPSNAHDIKECVTERSF